MEMSRIIINNKSSKSDSFVFNLVLNVISEGRVSDDGKCYCFLTSFTKSKTAVSARVTKSGTDSFIVWDRS